MKHWPAVRGKTDSDQCLQQRWGLFNSTKQSGVCSFVWLGVVITLPCVCLCVRLEVWCRVQPLRCVPGRVRPSNRCSWLSVAATGPQVRASRRSRTVRCVISRRCRRGVHHGCTRDRSNNWGTQAHALSYSVYYSFRSVEMIRVSRCFSLSIFDFQRVSLDGFGDGDLDERALQDSKYDMLEFAKKYFRQGTKGKGWDILTQKNTNPTE